MGPSIAFQRLTSVRLVDRLNQETSSLHAEVDEELVKQPVSARGYQRFLARTYGFVAPLERAITTTPAIEKYVDLRRFNKEELLRRDLLALHYTNHQIDGLPQCSVPLFNTAAEALGWGYFIERSTLAHGSAFRAVASNIPGEVAFASSYLKCYFGAVGEMWRAFGNTLDQIAADTDTDLVIEAARTAFKFYQRWREPDRESTQPDVTSTSGSLRLTAIEQLAQDDDSTLS
ncbi:MAG TPA: biliverdin-producing heme oxygenase [Kofleriaceae bacterium]|nr:biliverdin-producing heme oxygenase [Kofleriaceae bacterium]